jgi:LysM repeat protein
VADMYRVEFPRGCRWTARPMSGATIGLRRAPAMILAASVLTFGVATTAALAISVVTALPASALESTTDRYVIVKGDSLARLARRWKVSESRIRTANPGLRNRHHIQIGQRLVIPNGAVLVPATVAPASPPASPLPTPAVISPAVVAPGVPVPPAVPGATPLPAPVTHERPNKDTFPLPVPPVTHTVIAGDTLGAIAGKYEKTVAQIAKANKLADPNHVRVGYSLIIPAPEYKHLPSRLRVRTERLALMGHFDKAAAESGVDPSLLKALAWVESGWQPRVMSDVGAIGICQLMPTTAAELAVTLGDPSMNPWDPIDNIRMGARHLRLVLDDFDGDVRQAVAAYYQGSWAVHERGVSAKGSAYASAVVSHQRFFTSS